MFGVFGVEITRGAGVRVEFKENTWSNSEPVWGFRIRRQVGVTQVVTVEGEKRPVMPRASWVASYDSDSGQSWGS